MNHSNLTSKEYFILKTIIERYNGSIEKDSILSCLNKEIIRSLGIKGCIKSKNNFEFEVDSIGILEYNLYEKDVLNKFKK